MPVLSHTMKCVLYSLKHIELNCIMLIITRSVKKKKKKAKAEIPLYTGILWHQIYFILKIKNVLYSLHTF